MAPRFYFEIYFVDNVNKLFYFFYTNFFQILTSTHRVLKLFFSIILLHCYIANRLPCIELSVFSDIWKIEEKLFWTVPQARYSANLIRTCLKIVYWNIFKVYFKGFSLAFMDYFLVIWVYLDRVRILFFEISVIWFSNKFFVYLDFHTRFWEIFFLHFIVTILSKSIIILLLLLCKV